MTAHSLHQMASLPRDAIVRIEHSVRPDAKSSALIDETAVLRRSAMYRKAFKGAAVAYPAAFLGFDAFTAWIRRHEVTVDVTTFGELHQAMAAGIDPRRIVMHPGNGAEMSIHRAVNAGVARFVVSSSQQIAILAGSAKRIQRVVINPMDGATDSLVSQVLAHRGLDLIGLHFCLDDSDDAIGANKLRQLIAEMAWIRREHAILLSRISLGGLDFGDYCFERGILRRAAEAIDEVVGESCARHRYPRPALTLAPRCSALLPPR